MLSSGSGTCLAGALLVQRAEDGWGGQVAVGEGEDPVELDGRRQRRGELLAPSSAHRGAAEDGERDVAADFAGYRAQFLLRQAGAPELVAGDEGGGGVGAAAGHAASDRDPLDDGHRDPAASARASAAVPAAGGAGSVRAIASRRALTARSARLSPSSGTRPAPSPVTVTLSASAGRDCHVVEQGHRVEHGYQAVVAVRAQRADR